MARRFDITSAMAKAAGRSGYAARRRKSLQRRSVSAQLGKTCWNLSHGQDQELSNAKPGFTSSCRRASELVRFSVNGSASPSCRNSPTPLCHGFTCVDNCTEWRQLPEARDIRQIDPSQARTIKRAYDKYDAVSLAV
jgi:hypothetical protein